VAELDKLSGHIRRTGTRYRPKVIAGNHSFPENKQKNKVGAGAHLSHSGDQRAVIRRE
jgi:hypothetical protein